MALIDPLDEVPIARDELLADVRREREAEMNQLLDSSELKPPKDQPLKAWWQDGVNHSRFNYVWPAWNVTREERIDLMKQFLGAMEKAKYLIREESHGFKKGTSSEEKGTADTLPAVWLQHEQELRKQKYHDSQTLSNITAEYWAMFKAWNDEADGHSTDFLPDATAIQRLVKIVTLNIDAFEDEETAEIRQKSTIYDVYVPDRDRIKQLRDLLMMYIFDPIKSTFTTYFTLIKHRAQQFYTHEPFTNYESATDPRVLAWNNSLVRTTAVRTLHTARAKQAQVIRATNVYRFTFASLCKIVKDMQPTFVGGDSDQEMDWLLWVLVNTGCRQNEVWSTYYEFYPYPTDPDFDNLIPELKPYRLYFEMNGMRNDPQNWIIQLGSSKDKQKAKEGERVSVNVETGKAKIETKKWIEKPIAFRFPSKDIITAIGRLRLFAKDIWEKSGVEGVPYNEATPQQLTRIFNPMTTKRMAVRFPEAAAKAKKSGHSFGAHLCRSIYATIAYDFFSAFVPQYSKAAFVAKILGHDPTNLTTAQSYSNVDIIYTLPGRVTLDQRAVFERLFGEMAALHASMKSIETTIDPVMKRWESVPEASTVPEDVGLRKCNAQFVTHENGVQGFVNLPRLQPPKRPKDGERVAFVELAMNYLIDNNVDANTKNLVAVGCSAGWQTMYRKAMAELGKPTVVERRLGEDKPRRKRRKKEDASEPSSPAADVMELEDIDDQEEKEEQKEEEQKESAIEEVLSLDSERAIDEFNERLDNIIATDAFEESGNDIRAITEAVPTTVENLEAIPSGVKEIQAREEQEENEEIYLDELEKKDEEEQEQEEQEVPEGKKPARKKRRKLFEPWPYDAEGYIRLPVTDRDIDEREWDDYPGNNWEVGQARIEAFREAHPTAYDVQVIVPRRLDGKTTNKKKMREQRTSQHAYLRTVREYPPQFLTNEKMCKEEVRYDTGNGSYKQFNQWFEIGRKPEHWCWKEPVKSK